MRGWYVPSGCLGFLQSAAPRACFSVHAIYARFRNVRGIVADLAGATLNIHEYSCFSTHGDHQAVPGESSKQSNSTILRPRDEVAQMSSMDACAGASNFDTLLRNCIRLLFLPNIFVYMCYILPCFCLIFLLVVIPYSFIFEYIWQLYRIISCSPCSCCTSDFWQLRIKIFPFFGIGFPDVAEWKKLVPQKVVFFLESYPSANGLGPGGLDSWVPPFE